MLDRALTRCFVVSALAFCWCCPGALADDWRDRQAKWWTVSDVAYDALVALEPPRRAAESAGDGSSVVRIASAAEGLLLLFDDQNSEAAMRKLVALGHFDFGAASSVIYECVVVRKGRAITPMLEQELSKADSEPCFAAFGDGSSLCPSNLQTSKRLRILLQRIETNEPCTIVQ